MGNGVQLWPARCLAQVRLFLGVAFLRSRKCLVPSAMLVLHVMHTMPMPPTLLLLLPATGWWCWADALVHQKAVVAAPYPFTYNWPGIGEPREVPIQKGTCAPNGMGLE